MLAKDLKEYLDKIPDEANIMIFVHSTAEVRQLIFTDLDRNHYGHVIIDAEYIVPTKFTKIGG